MSKAQVPGYPPHLWIEPHKTIMTSLVIGYAVSLGEDITPAETLNAAHELALQGFLKPQPRYWAAGIWYRKYVAGPKTDIRALKFAY